MPGQIWYAGKRVIGDRTQRGLSCSEEHAVLTLQQLSKQVRRTLLFLSHGRIVGKVVSISFLVSHLRPLRRLVPELLLQLPLVFHKADGVSLCHLLHVHLRHAVVLFQVLIPRRVEVLKLHVVGYLCKENTQRGSESSVLGGEVDQPLPAYDDKDPNVSFQKG